MTKEQIETANVFHHGTCRVSLRDGKLAVESRIFKRHGKTRRWKDDPEAFAIPIRHGVANHATLHNNNASEFHLAEECPCRHLRKTR
jgi:hypothetical protein